MQILSYVSIRQFFVVENDIVSVPYDLKMDTIYPSLRHLQLKTGISDCRYGGKCYNTSAKHNDTYRHPDFCPDTGYCRVMSDKHLFANRHVPLCQYALQCHKKMMPDHSRQTNTDDSKRNQNFLIKLFYRFFNEPFLVFLFFCDYLIQSNLMKSRSTNGFLVW